MTRLQPTLLCWPPRCFCLETYDYVEFCLIQSYGVTLKTFFDGTCYVIGHLELLGGPVKKNHPVQIMRPTAKAEEKKLYAAMALLIVEQPVAGGDTLNSFCYHV